jgi:glycosyltransferase involved in cell wall biosynthesis
MRIAVLVSHYPAPFKPYYDAQFSQFLEDGHELQIFSARSLGEVLNEKVIRWGLGRRTAFFPATLRDTPSAVPALVKAFLSVPGRSFRNLTSGWRGGGRRWRTKLANGIRAVVIGSRQPDFCLVHELGTAVMFSWLREVFPEVPIGLYYHGGEVPSVSPLDDQAASTAFLIADAVFTNTRFSRDHAVKRGCPPERIHVMPVGFDLRDFQPPESREYRKGGTLRLLSAGRMSEEKGFIYALQALRHLVHERGITDIEYRLTGEGYIRGKLERYIEDNDLGDYVSFLGTISTEALIQEQTEADVLLLPSIQVGNWVENQACAVQETMLLKGVVIVSRTGGVPESVAPEMRRFITEEKDWRGLAKSIEEVYRMSETELSELGERGREFVRKNYDIARLNRELIEKTLEVAGGRISSFDGR